MIKVVQPEKYNQTTSTKVHQRDPQIVIQRIYTRKIQPEKAEYISIRSLRTDEWTTESQPENLNKKNLIEESGIQPIVV